MTDQIKNKEFLDNLLKILTQTSEQTDKYKFNYDLFCGKVFARPQTNSPLLCKGVDCKNCPFYDSHHMEIAVKQLQDAIENAKIAAEGCET